MIEEMIKTIHEGLKPLKETYSTQEIASVLYNAGYRKQVEGEWIKKGLSSIVCSNCDYMAWDYHRTQYCPNCGAKMKG